MSECLRIKEEFREKIVFELISKDEPDRSSSFAGYSGDRKLTFRGTHNWPLHLAPCSHKMRKFTPLISCY